MTMSSSQILSHIGELVEEERNLRERHGERQLDAPERLRMEEIETRR